MAGKERRPAMPVAGSPPGTEAARIELTGLTKRYITPAGEPFTAIQDVTFTVEPGQFCAIVGPTGCGKSTTLGQVSGLERPSAGSVKVGGQPVTGVTTGVSFMFQADALFPWKSVLGNVMIGPTLNGTRKSEAVALARTHDLDLAVLDVAMPRMTGLQAAREIAARQPGLRILMLSMYDNEQYFFEALRAGASGYVLKSVADRDLVAACRSAVRGEPFLYPGAVTALIRDAARECGAPVVSVLEGGYDLAALGRSARAHVETLKEPPR